MATNPIQAAYHTLAGRRPTNQDAVAVQDLPSGRKLLALADGMGGHLAGDVASRKALEALSDALADGATIEAAVQAANAAVHKAAADHPEWQGMGTTLVVLLQTGRRYQIASVGDSRAYRVDTAGIRQITTDHSVAAEAQRNGSAAAAEVAASPWRNAVTRALGTEPEVAVDVFGPFDATVPHTVVLCSDGLYGAVGDNLVRDHVFGAKDLPASVWRLTREALAKGSTDNISVIVARFDPATEADEDTLESSRYLGDWLRDGPGLPPVDIPELGSNGKDSDFKAARSDKKERRKRSKKRTSRRSGQSKSLLTKLADSMEIAVLLVLVACILALWLLF